MFGQGFEGLFLLPFFSFRDDVEVLLGDLMLDLLCALLQRFGFDARDSVGFGPALRRDQRL